MLISSSTRFIQVPFDSEAELENVVVQNYEYLFGPSSIYLPKGTIWTEGGAATIPDGFAFDLAKKQWFIVEAELAKHSLWNHIAPQVAKQITAALNPESKSSLIRRIVALVRDDATVRSKFEDEGIEQIDIRKVLDDILNTQPLLGIPIDAVSADLRGWASMLKYETKLWIVRKHVELSDLKNVIYELPEEYRPAFDSHEEVETAATGGLKFCDVTIEDLLKAGLLAADDQLFMSYKRKEVDEDRKTYSATIENDGSLRADDQLFSSPSDAAIYFINKAGSPRKTVNGWTTWRARADTGKLLSELREQFLISREKREP